MKNVLILAGGQIARHVIDRLADEQAVVQTLFARQPEKIQQPHPANARIFIGDVEPIRFGTSDAGAGSGVCQPDGR